MLKKLAKNRTTDITWQGEVVATVRAISPGDIASILTTAGEDLSGVLSIAEEVDAMKLDTKNSEALADQLLAKWPAVVRAVGEHLPKVLAQLIACAADAPDDWELVQEEYSFALQFEILAKVAELTFDGPEGFKRFVGNALLLVDLSGSLTSSAKKQNSTRGDRRSLVAG